MGAKGSDTPPVTDEELDHIRRALEFDYPWAYLTGIPKKLSVSVLSSDALDAAPLASGIDGTGDSYGNTSSAAESDADTNMELPRFMSGSNDGIAAERGTSTHVFLQFADFERLRAEGAENELSRLLSLGFITRDMAQLVNLSQVTAFAQSLMMDRILTAHSVMREFRFNVALPAERFTSDGELKRRLAESGETLTVQGVFDCIFEDAEGHLVLLDYKTDALSESEKRDPKLGAMRLKNRHKRQLGYYREAAECLFGRRPDEVYIYSLTLGECIAM